jgi:phenylalanyl-tRNA synthetase beta subunit
MPKGVNAVSLVYAAKKATGGAAYYRVRKYLMDLLAEHTDPRMFRLEPLATADLQGNPWLEQMTAPYDPARSAVLLDVSSSDTQGLIWGVAGEFKPAVRRALKLPDTVAGFEVDPLLFTRNGAGRSYVPLPKFPKVIQDMTLRVGHDVSYAAVYQAVWEGLSANQPANTLPTLSPRGIYQSADDPEHKNITLRLSIASYDRTLTEAVVSTMLEAAAAKAHDELGTERV